MATSNLRYVEFNRFYQRSSLQLGENENVAYCGVFAVQNVCRSSSCALYNQFESLMFGLD